MTIDADPWTKFTDSGEIPEWISNAYSDSYQGPHQDEADAEAELAAAPAVTSALLGAHYRLGAHRPAGESRVAVYPPDGDGGFGPALQVVTDDGAMLMDSVTVLLHRLGVAYAAIMNPVFHVRRDSAGDLLMSARKTSAATGSTKPGSTSNSHRRSTATRCTRPNVCCPASLPTFGGSRRTRRR